MRRGFIDHSDSLGATARFGRGDVQWLTAGEGIVHCEMFPLLDRDGPNPCELFQIWLNLPAADKMVEPYFTMLWDEDIPRLASTDDDGRTTEVTVDRRARSAGADGRRRRRPSSWASRPEADLAIWHLAPEPGAAWTLPPAAGADTVRTLYVFEGAVQHRRARARGADRRACCAPTSRSTVTGGPDGAEALVLQGRPIGEPVAQYGPFVMNDEAGIEQAFADYRAHRLRRLAVADRRSGARPRRGPLRPPRRRPRRAPRRGGGDLGRAAPAPSFYVRKASLGDAFRT